MILVEGGTYHSRAEQDVMYDWNNRPTARVTVFLVLYGPNRGD
ncbi:MAG: hypothetical protein R2779_03040 [Crocinitomicaceae bacterium]